MKINWKNRALKRQLAYKKEIGLKSSGLHGGIEYEHILSNKDAGNGNFFYCHKDLKEWNNLQSWAEKSKGKKINLLGAGLKNMLRSEHIPYNLFYPLEKLRLQQSKKLNEFLEGLCPKQIHVDKVNKIKIEYASDLHKSQLLEDNTSFDVYIEYQNGEKICGLGIEVKYTEKSYPYGRTEKERMWDDKSLYNVLSRRSGIYKKEAFQILRTKQLKQAWRNHLLGLKLLELGKLHEFHSVHLYPESNTYQANMCEEYIECLKEEDKQSFLPITFEQFIETAEEVFSENTQHKWIKYLKERY